MAACGGKLVSMALMKDLSFTTNAWFELKQLWHGLAVWSYIPKIRIVIARPALTSRK
jgi:hypothetical protein